MWCKNNGCCHYDKEKDKCGRIGEDESNTGKIGVCWIAENEYRHDIK